MLDAQQCSSVRYWGTQFHQGSIMGDKLGGALDRAQTMVHPNEKHYPQAGLLGTANLFGRLHCLAYGQTLLYE